MLKLIVGLLPLLLVSCGDMVKTDVAGDAARRQGTGGLSQIYLGDAEEQSKGTCVNSTIDLRSGAGFDFGVVEHLDLGKNAYTILNSDKSWVKIKLNSNDLTGYVFSEDLCADAKIEEQPSAIDLDDSTISRQKVLDLSAAFVGFSYWWGGAKLKVGSSDRGQCKKINGKNDYKGHSGTYGADCSGFAAKVWMLPAAMPLENQSHPYSTYDFYNKTILWSVIERKNVTRADALVYRSDTGGHIVIYDSGDNWNQIKTYEAKGCAYGIVHQLRAISTAYKLIKRNNIQN